MKLADFDYHLPEELIADTPLKQRDSSRLLVCTEGNMEDVAFSQLPTLLNAGDVMVLNDTKVLPARLFGKCGDSNVQVTLLKKLSDEGDGELWQALAKPGKKLQKGAIFKVAEDLSAIAEDKKESGEINLRFSAKGNALLQLLHRYGSMPLPPYIEKKRKAGETDKASYQTVYANNSKEGSVAAPTAGLHFTPQLLQQIKEKGVEVVFVTLHVGAGTFMPVRAENIKDHVMHYESYEVSEAAAEAINRARKNGGRVIAAGTTSLRTLESAADAQGHVKSGSAETGIFIYPGYEFKVVDALITNFHLPCSTLLMLVSAFMGMEHTRNIYAHAIAQRYRFFSYGDGSFLQPSTRVVK